MHHSKLHHSLSQTDTDQGAAEEDSDNILPTSVVYVFRRPKGYTAKGCVCCVCCLQNSYHSFHWGIFVIPLSEELATDPLKYNIYQPWRTGLSIEIRQNKLGLQIIPNHNLPPDCNSMCMGLARLTPDQISLKGSSCSYFANV